MNTDRELMQQALEAMDTARPACFADNTLEAIDNAITALRSRLAQPEQEFIEHHGDDEGWSEWVCPDPKGYLMKCCDCGLVHEAQFQVVRYSPGATEDCDTVNDPDLQAVFRMRRSDEWTPKDTAYRPGGLAQPEQEPVKFNCTVVDDAHPEGVPLSQWGQQQKQKPFCYHDGRNIVGKEYAHHCDVFPLYTEPHPEQEPLTDEEIADLWGAQIFHVIDLKLAIDFVRDIERAHGIGEKPDAA